MARAIFLAARNCTTRSAGLDATGNLNTAREFHTATLLPNGKVLVAGGEGPTFVISAELYDPAMGTWTFTRGNLTAPRVFHTATLLPNGKVLVAGGYNTNDLVLSEHRTVRPSQRDMECHRQPQHCTLQAHRDSASQR